MKNEKECKLKLRSISIHIGLLVCIIVYLFLGTCLFYVLEKRAHDTLCYEGKMTDTQQRLSLRENVIKYVQINLTNSVNLSMDINLLNDMIRTYARFTIYNKGSTFYVGQDCDVDSTFNLSNILLFAITIISTIGYGHIFPITDQGKIAVIIYSLLGTPLFLVFIGKLSSTLGDSFRYFFFNILLRPFKNSKRKHALNENDKQTTIVKLNSDDKKQSVPLTITMTIILLFILLGAFLFNTFEGWNLIKASYFCFITLATIGFGDLVPGQNFGDSDRNLKLIIGSAYILFGLAVLAMCFDLVQNEIMEKFTWFGNKIGLIRKEDHDEDLDEEQDERALK